MSVDIQWEILTGGAEGVELAETIRAFIHDRFQKVALPRFIRSVNVHSFDFGDAPPDIEVKDICDPLPDFYEDEDDSASSVSDGRAQDEDTASTQGLPLPPGDRSHEMRVNSNPGGETTAKQSQTSPPVAARLGQLRIPRNVGDHPLSPLFSAPQSAGIPGGTSNLTYFHLPFGAGLSGTTTPLAAVAGSHFHNGWPDNLNFSQPQSLGRATHQPSSSLSSVTPPSSSDPTSRPPSQHRRNSSSGLGFDGQIDQDNISSHPGLPRDRSPNDMQVVAHVKYSGNLKLHLTAEILLDYPMPSFVGIPLQLHITGVTFDGVAIIAYINKKAHFCFLSPEDAETYLGLNHDDDHRSESTGVHHKQSGSLFEEIRVESEIGQKENGKQVLKNVGKVEKFVLDQVRRIFEDEFVFPSFWTFLV
jgi:mitochondrial distribution and morphology protein 12